MKLGLSRTLSLSISMLVLFFCACSSTHSNKTELLFDFKHSTQNAEDFKKWASVFKDHEGQNGSVSFVFDNDEFRAYILADKSFLSSLGGVKGMNNYSCPERSKYCSVCINLKDMSVGCKQGKEDELGPERGLIASNQEVTLRDMIVAGEKKREVRMLFSGYPAEVMMNRSLPHKCHHVLLHVMRSLSLAPKSKSKDVSCVTDNKMVICQALINVTRI